MTHRFADHGPVGTRRKPDRELPQDGPDYDTDVRTAQTLRVLRDPRNHHILNRPEYLLPPVVFDTPIL
jgi:hypothetical protein